jgi:hypothetical protein
MMNESYPNITKGLTRPLCIDLESGPATTGCMDLSRPHQAYMHTLIAIYASGPFDTKDIIFIHHSVEFLLEH